MPKRPRTYRASHAKVRRTAHHDNSWWTNKGGRSYYYGRVSKPHVPKRHRRAYRKAQVGSFFHRLINRFRA